jgi:ubiquinone biosynthesis protein
MHVDLLVTPVTAHFAVPFDSVDDHSMLDASAIAAGLGRLAPEQLRATLETLLPKGVPTVRKIATVESALNSPIGQSLRDTMAQWIVDEIVPVNSLVPEAYVKWRAPVRDAMVFVVARLSPARLAPKLVEQMELSADTPSEIRLLRLISKVPGLQKLGQVIARNQHLRPALRRELAKLENGIRDVTAAEIRALVEEDLGLQLKRFEVRLSSEILKEASVSAVVRFTWRNPETGKRERGVFKVLKLHIPKYFAEDMEYLQGLAQYFGDRHHTYGFAPHLIPDTFRKVRRLLRHEVNFTREQETLAEAASLYRHFPGVRIPRVIRPLCTPRITALSEEKGIKITSAAARLPATQRRRVVEQLVEALVAVPLISPTDKAVFHGDPHAGNLLYDARSGELAIIDWALREHLDREQRRHLALLFLVASLRDPVALFNEVSALTQLRVRKNTRQARAIRDTVSDFLNATPPSHMPSVGDAMRLLERIAVKGVKFPASLIMLSKVMVTLEGILADIAGSDAAIGFTIARHVALRWLANRSAYHFPLKARDWFTLQCSALLFTGRLCVQWEQSMLERLVAPKPLRSSAPI